MNVSMPPSANAGTQVTALAILLLLVATPLGCTSVRPPKEITQTSLPRPVVIIGGIGDPFIGATRVGRYIKENTREQRVIGVSPGFAPSFDAAADQVVDAVERYFPSMDADQTVEVDVIGISMGGLVARHAAAPGRGVGRKRLNVRRMYTLAAPHSGAMWADWFGFVGPPAAMRTGSDFLGRLVWRERTTEADDYELVAYWRPRDLTIGDAGLIPPAHLNAQQVRFNPAWWELSSHNGVFRDRRILADLVRRLRSEGKATSRPTPG